MKQKNQRSLFFLGLFLGLFILSIMSLPISQFNCGTNDEIDSLPELSAQSTNPSTPTQLIDGVSQGPPLIASTNYYYKTGNAFPTNYQLVWLNPNGSYDYNLYLFSNTSYTDLETSSIRGGNSLEWVIFRTSDITAYYPQINGSSSGSAYIEWQTSDPISTGGSDSKTLSSSNSIIIYETFFFTTTNYDLRLELPVGADYDLYIFRLDEGGAINFDGYIARSATTGVEVNEAILGYNPPTDGKYAVLAVRISGSGSYTLRVEIASNSGIPSFELIPVFFGLCISILLILKFSRPKMPSL